MSDKKRSMGDLKVMRVEKAPGVKMRLVPEPGQPKFAKTVDAERWARDTSRKGFKPGTLAIVRIAKTLKVSRPTMAAAEEVDLFADDEPEATEE